MDRSSTNEGQKIEGGKLPSSNSIGGCTMPASVRITLVDPWMNPIKPLEDLFAFEGLGSAQTLSFKNGQTVTVRVPAPGEGRFSFKGTKENLARVCEFLPEEKGKDDSRQPEWVSPAQQYSKNGSRRVHVGPATFHQLCEGIPIRVERGLPREYVVEVDVAAGDWCIIMAFLDNHSANLHGSGHAGVMFFEGASGKGMYADFGPYHEIKSLEAKGKEKVLAKLAEVRISEEQFGFRAEKNKLVDAGFSEFFNTINERYGSGIKSKNQCVRTFLEGPEHEHTIEYTFDGQAIITSPDNFAVNGLIAWAAFKLRKGAFNAMKTFCEESQARAEQEQKKAIYTTMRKIPSQRWNDFTGKARQRVFEAPSQNFFYGVGYNCMTFSLAVLEQGRHPQNAKATDFSWNPEEARNFNMDHPNDHIGSLMAKANDAGFFDHRRFLGENEAVTNAKQTEQASIIRPHQALSCVSYSVDTP